MRLSGDVSVEAKLKTVVRHLVLSFRQAAQLSGPDWLISMPPWKRFKGASTRWLARVSIRPVKGPHSDHPAEEPLSRMARSTFQVRPYHRLPAHCSLLCRRSTARHRARSGMSRSRAVGLVPLCLFRWEPRWPSSCSCLSPSDRCSSTPPQCVGPEVPSTAFVS
jgi:hypothetical protein